MAVLGLLTECIHLAKIPSPSVTGICNYLSGSAQRENNAEDGVLWIPTHILTFSCALKSDCYRSRTTLPSCRPSVHLWMCVSCHLVSASSREGAAKVLLWRLIHWLIIWPWLGRILIKCAGVWRTDCLLITIRTESLLEIITYVLLTFYFGLEAAI